MAAKKTVEVPGEALHGHVDVPGGAAGKVSPADSPWADRAKAGQLPTAAAAAVVLVLWSPAPRVHQQQVRRYEATAPGPRGPRGHPQRRAACFGLGGLTLNEFR